MKARPNKLDRFAEQFPEWVAEGKTLAQIQEQLKLDGCVASLSSISEYLSRLHQKELEEKLFATIATGGRMNKELSQAFERNPAPDVARLIEVTKTLVLSLQVHGVAEPKLLALANSMQQTVLNYLSGLTKAEIEKEKLAQGARRLAVLESNVSKAKAELQKLRDPKAELGEEDRKAIVDKVDEILGLK